VNGFVDCVQRKERRAAGEPSSAGGLRVMMQRSICYIIEQVKGVRGGARARSEG
jgi:hypothetical protein